MRIAIGGAVESRHLEAVAHAFAVVQALHVLVGREGVVAGGRIDGHRAVLGGQLGHMAAIGGDQGVGDDVVGVHVAAGDGAAGAVVLVGGQAEGDAIDDGRIVGAVDGHVHRLRLADGVAVGDRHLEGLPGLVAVVQRLGLVVGREGVFAGDRVHHHGAVLGLEARHQIAGGGVDDAIGQRVAVGIIGVEIAADGAILAHIGIDLRRAGDLGAVVGGAHGDGHLHVGGAAQRVGDPHREGVGAVPVVVGRGEDEVAVLVHGQGAVVGAVAQHLVADDVAVDVGGVDGAADGGGGGGGAFVAGAAGDGDLGFVVHIVQANADVAADHIAFVVAHIDGDGVLAPPILVIGAIDVLAGGGIVDDRAVGGIRETDGDGAAIGVEGVDAEPQVLAFLAVHVIGTAGVGRIVEHHLDAAEHRQLVDVQRLLGHGRNHGLGSGGHLDGVGLGLGHDGRGRLLGLDQFGSVNHRRRGAGRGQRAALGFGGRGRFLGRELLQHRGRALDGGKRGFRDSLVAFDGDFRRADLAGLDGEALLPDGTRSGPLVDVGQRAQLAFRQVERANGIQPRLAQGLIADIGQDREVIQRLLVGRLIRGPGGRGRLVDVALVGHGSLPAKKNSRPQCGPGSFEAL